MRGKKCKNYACMLTFTSLWSKLSWLWGSNCNPKPVYRLHTIYLVYNNSPSPAQFGQPVLAGWCRGEHDANSFALFGLARFDINEPMVWTHGSEGRFGYTSAGTFTCCTCNQAFFSFEAAHPTTSVAAANVWIPCCGPCPNEVSESLRLNQYSLHPRTILKSSFAPKYEAFIACAGSSGFLTIDNHIWLAIDWMYVKK